MQNGSGLSEVKATILEKIMASQLRERRTLKRPQIKKNGTRTENLIKQRCKKV